MGEAVGLFPNAALGDEELTLKVVGLVLLVCFVGSETHEQCRSGNS